MRKLSGLTLAMLTLAACTSTPRVETLLTQWDFTHDGHTETVTVPHDWAISEPFDRSYDLQEVIVVQNGETEPTWKTGRSGGLPWMGTGEYHTVLRHVDTTRFYTLVIDGAMSHADVFINGEEVCYRPYGYTTFDLFVSPFITGDSIDILVCLENKPQQSRWYPGAGLYRNVHLIATDRIHIPTAGTFITTPDVTAEQATVRMEIALLNGVDSTTAEAEGVRVVTDILYRGRTVATLEGQRGETTVPHPQLWSPESPNLYTARTRVLRGNKVLDQYDTRFGIRTISYSAENGFQLNGVTRKFKGVCNHHDLGPLGVAVHRDALRHQIAMLRDMGCDAIRTSHNMPDPQLVELCDEMGMMMMIEPFDVWNWGKTDNDYHVEFDDWHVTDIEDMVRYYRNSPCVMLWSSGNEVWNQVLPDGIALVTHLQEVFHRMDPTRPVTNGMDQARSVIHNGFGDAVEIPGFNYRTGRYHEGHEHMHHGFLLGSETASTVSSRGVYKLPVEIRPDALYADNQCSGYDVEYCSWSGLPDQDFELQDDYPWTIGQFVWTGFDYLGEPSPYDTDAWPSHSSYFGIIDLASLPKDRYWLYRSQWNRTEPTLHLLPHWNWSEGDTVPVVCYTSYPSAELFVNGVSHGRLWLAPHDDAQRDPERTYSREPRVGDFTIAEWGSAPRPELLPRYRLMWFDIPYEPGEIRVVAYGEDDKPVAEQSIRTAGAPHSLRAEWSNRDEHPDELCYVTVSVVDAEGNLCPMSDALIRCTEGSFVAAANGDAASLDAFVRPQMHAFAGQCTFIIKKGGKATFAAEGLRPASVRL